MSPSHGLNVLAHGASLVAVTAAMAVMGTAVVVAATWEGTWPGQCEGMRGGAGQGGAKREGSEGGTVEGANGAPMIGPFCAVDTHEKEIHVKGNTHEMHMLIFKNSENLSMAVACEIHSMKRAGHVCMAGTRKFEVDFLFRRWNGTTSPGTQLHAHLYFCVCPPAHAPSLCSAQPR